jgi:general stress protein YciG
MAEDPIQPLEDGAPVERFREMGRKGGKALAQKKGPEFYVEIGRKGGNTVKTRHGADHYLRIGHKGGTAVKDKYGADYYSAIGKKRWEKRAQKAAETDTPPITE